MRLEVTPTIEKNFEASCLPRTMRIALKFKATLLATLPRSDRTWPLEDRVLVWLLPNLEVNVTAFHESGGPDMGGIFLDHQLEHLDEVLESELFKRLEAV